MPTVSKTVPQTLWKMIKKPFLAFDHKVDGAISFFFKHFGKTRFMIAMSKKIQVHGFEKVFDMGPKAFFYFFMFYLVRDTILYIIIPIYFARMTGE
ncbi:MAG: hypothetical protein KC493_12535 [Bacteriovoracaceae bacterium]|nr:hypothetical protein [Bacteriovoracaceae bacterium]